MLQGWFDGEEQSPLIAGEIWIPALDLRGPIEFLIDTGSDETVLMPKDALALGIDHSKLTMKRETSYGAGGACSDFITPARVIFTEPTAVIYQWNIDLRIADPTEDHFRFPSLLGRDIINKWNLTHNPLGRCLQAEVLRFDAVKWLDPEREAAHEANSQRSTLKIRKAVD